MRFKHNRFIFLDDISYPCFNAYSSNQKERGARNYRHYFGCLSVSRRIRLQRQVANVGLMYGPTKTTTAFGCHSINVNFKKHTSNVFLMVGRTRFISYKDSFLMQLTGVARGNDHIILYLYDKPTYAYLSICSITYYHFPAISFGHSSGHH
jgi:hypothetical protein